MADQGGQGRVEPFQGIDGHDEGVMGEPGGEGLPPAVEGTGGVGRKRCLVGTGRHLWGVGGRVVEQIAGVSHRAELRRSSGLLLPGDKN
jgi:hypothetical protein